MEDFTEALPTTTYPTSSSTTSTSSSSSSSSTTTASNVNLPNTTSASAQTVQAGGKNVSRKGGIIFPSVKNKPSVLNNTFASESLLFKDIKVSLF